MLQDAHFSTIMSQKKANSPFIPEMLALILHISASQGQIHSLAPYHRPVGRYLSKLLT